MTLTAIALCKQLLATVPRAQRAAIDKNEHAFALRPMRNAASSLRNSTPAVSSSASAIFASGNWSSTT